MFEYKVVLLFRHTGGDGVPAAISEGDCACEVVIKPTCEVPTCEVSEMEIMHMNEKSPQLPTS